MVARTTNPTQGVDPGIVNDIRRASRSANVDFNYLMAQAAQESNFQPNAKAASSSATGLFQFIDSTWLNAVKDYGAKYGLATYANAINAEDGSAHVADKGLRKQILDLRKDPALNAALAAELAHSNKAAVENALGRTANATDLYLAHFLGAEGATRFVKSIESGSQTKAADLMPQAAAANRSVFFDSNGQAKTVGQIYRSFASKIEGQISKFIGGSSTPSADGHAGTFDETLASTSAIPPTGIDLPKRLNQSMLTMMNVLSFAALKMLGQKKSDDQLSHTAPSDTERKRPTDVSA